jgi:hypothetical protein
MAALGWDARFNRPAVRPTPGPAGESTFPPPSIEAVLSQLQRWEQALQAEVQAETDGLASTRDASPSGNVPVASTQALAGNVPVASTQALEAVGTKEEEEEPGGDRDGSDIDMVAAMMAAAMR